MSSPLISGSELAARLGEPCLRVLDFRWYPDGRSVREAYLAGHVPGAVLVELDAELTPPGGPGRHPLPDPETFAAVLRRAGVHADDEVVVYDDAGSSIAARLWWMLRASGHQPVRVLDGGLAAFPGPLASGEEPPPAPGDLAARPFAAGLAVGYEDVRDRDPGAVLLDARTRARYAGEPSPLDPRRGHIPGARSAPWAENLGPDGRFQAPERLRERFAALGATGENTIVYCGSGVTACHDLLALELAGLPGARLYVGSWSDWASRADAPAELAGVAP